jgi:hypothetical protein
MKITRLRAREMEEEMMSKNNSRTPSLSAYQLTTILIPIYEKI